MQVEPEDKKTRIKAVRMSCDGLQEFDPSGQIPDCFSVKKNFFMLLVAKPGSGKTAMMYNLLAKKNRFWGGLFDRIHIFSPSIHTVNEKFHLPPDRFHDSFAELDSVLKGIKKGQQVCLVFDDMAAMLKKGQAGNLLLKAIANRRHMGLSIILTAQRFLMVPKELRAMATNVCVWPTANRKELASVYEELIGLDQVKYKQVCELCWKDSPHHFLMLDCYACEQNKYYKNFHKITL